MTQVRKLIEQLSELPPEEEIVFQFLRQSHVAQGIDEELTDELWSRIVEEEDKYGTAAFAFDEMVVDHAQILIEFGEEAELNGH